MYGIRKGSSMNARKNELGARWCVCVCVKNGTLTQTLYGFRLTVESMREAWQTRCVHGLERTASLR